MLDLILLVLFAVWLVVMAVVPASGRVEPPALPKRRPRVLWPPVEKVELHVAGTTDEEIVERLTSSIV